MLARWRELCDELAQHRVRLLAVSKYVPDEAVACLIGAGQRQFGESRPQSLRNRATQWPDCDWHMIGPLQANKAKYIGRHAACWHSVEDIDTARKVAAQVEGRRLPVLIQVNAAGNPGQHGVAPDAAVIEALATELAGLPQLELCGLMTMGPPEGDPRPAFRRLARLREELFGGSLAELCMGMSDDYRVAVEEGATMVRLGSTLFGPWNR